MRRLLSLLFILTLAARSAVPAGFMLAPSVSGDGSMTVVICTGHGPQIVTLDANGKPIPAKPAAGDLGLCAFAGHVALVAPDFEASLLVQLDFAVATTVWTIAVNLPPARAGPVGSRAPPHIS